MVPRLDPFQHHIIVADGVADFQQLLPRHGALSVVHRQKRKKLSADARHRQNRNHRSFVLRPHHLRAHLLRHAQFSLCVLHDGLRQHRLRFRIHLRRNERNSRVGDLIPGVIHQMHRRAHLQIPRAVCRDVDVRLQSARLIHRRQ